jgi:type IV pilus assembly protein PilE
MRSSFTPGFTLIELLIVLGIVGLLATVAYPGYQQSVLRAHRAEGIAAVLRVQMAQEKFRSNCPFYAQALGDSSVCATSAVASTLQAPSASPSGYYAISIVPNSASGSSYTISAMPVGSQARDTLCAPMALTIMSSNPHGRKTPANCW